MVTTVDRKKSDVPLEVVIKGKKRDPIIKPMNYLGIFLFLKYHPTKRLSVIMRTNHNLDKGRPQVMFYINKINIQCSSLRAF